MLRAQIGAKILYQPLTAMELERVKRDFRDSSELKCVSVHVNAIISCLIPGFLQRARMQGYAYLTTPPSITRRITGRARQCRFQPFQLSTSTMSLSNSAGSSVVAHSLSARVCFHLSTWSFGEDSSRKASGSLPDHVFSSLVSIYLPQA